MTGRRATDLELAQTWIASECDAVKELLLAKNRSYGNSFATPIAIFAKSLPPDAQLRVRIDDKLKRIADGTDEMNDDTVMDLIGYLVLWRVLQRMKEGP